MKNSRYFNFMIELLFAVLIFVISISVVVNIFVYGNRIDHKNIILNEAHSFYISTLEKLRFYNGESLSQYLQEFDLAKNHIDVKYEEDHFLVSIIDDKEVLVKTEIYYVGEVNE